MRARGHARNAAPLVRSGPLSHRPIASGSSPTTTPPPRATTTSEASSGAPRLFTNVATLRRPSGLRRDHEAVRAAPTAVCGACSAQAQCDDPQPGSLCVFRPGEMPAGYDTPVGSDSACLWPCITDDDCAAFDWCRVREH